MKKQTSFLAALDVYGFDAVEPVILAALVTEDPLLMIGRSGTGKTYLLNSLSEELGLEHRHYNASLISFDDLVGFPYPDEDGSGVKFLETPATVWGAESVLIDEISRCKPEHQNRLFSLVHERKVQGIPIPRLRFRWAAMNPCSADQGGEDYAGSEPLDPALADRFSLFVWAVDWDDLSDSERLKVANPAGEGKIASDGGRLKKQLADWRKTFLEQLPNCPDFILQYASRAVSEFNDFAEVRISPRRARLLTRSLLSASIVAGAVDRNLFQRVLGCSVPHVAWGEPVRDEAVAAVHRIAWEHASQTDGSWVHDFMAARKLPKKLEILLDSCADLDEGTQAIAQFINAARPEVAAAFALAVYPAAVMEKLPLGADGVNELGKVASSVLSVDGDVRWPRNLGEGIGNHPDFDRYARVIARKRGGRRERAKQFFDWCLVGKIKLADPSEAESQLEACVQVLKKRGLV